MSNDDGLVFRRQKYSILMNFLLENCFFFIKKFGGLLINEAIFRLIAYRTEAGSNMYASATSVNAFT